jgi:hypothetical protein
MSTSRFSAMHLALGASLIAPLASSIEPIPETPGWRGFVVVGAGYTDVKSNLVPGNDLIDVGRDTIVSINDTAQSDDATHPIVGGEVNYTFGNQWQVFLGTSLEDAVTLDGVAQFGVRKGLGGAGILQGGFLFSGLPNEVWEDPYAEGVQRESTDRDSSGLRLQWDRILGSAFEFTVSYRDIEVDTERSGQGVTSVLCDAACQDLLRRDGDQVSLDLSYRFRPGPHHLLRPMVRYTSHELDGNAMSGDAYRLQLSYVYVGGAYTLVGNIAMGGRDHDEANPLYGIKTDSDRPAVDATLFYRLPSASGRWQIVGNVLWGDDDSDVDFHDTEVFQISLGAMYRFGAAGRAAPVVEERVY